MQLPLRLSAALVAALALTLTITGSAFAAAPANDNFADAELIVPGADAVSGTTVEATREVGEPGSGSGSVWYRVNGTAVGAVTFTVCRTSGETAIPAKGYIDDGTGGFTALVAYEAKSSYLCSEAVRVGVTPDTDAYLQVDAGDDEFEVSATFTASPANDAFADADVLTGEEATTAFDTTNATWELGEPPLFSPANDLTHDGRSLWYEWTAPATGTVTLTACSPSSSSRPKVTLYDGTSIDALTFKRSDAATCSTSHYGGAIFYEVVGGTNYRIRVNNEQTDSYAGAGQLDLQFNGPLTNDNVADATDLGNTFPVSTSGYNWTATTESGEPSIRGGTKPHSVWFKWTAPKTGSVRVDMCEQHARIGDLVVEAFTSSGGATASPSQLQKISDSTSADDNCVERGNNNRRGWFDLPITAGTTYWIGIASYSNGEIGPFSLSLIDSTLRVLVDPVISGALFVGKTLSVDDGVWDAHDTPTMTYQWWRCNNLGNACAPLAGETTSTYTLVAADAGQTIKAQVGATTSMRNLTFSSPATPVVDFDSDGDGVGDAGDLCPGAANGTSKSNGCPVIEINVTAEPAIGGTPAVGGGVVGQAGSAANASSIDPTIPAPTYSISVESCSSPVETTSCSRRTVGAGYVPTADDVGRYLRARVVWSNGDREVERWSSAIGPVPAATLPQVNPASIKLPKKLGTLKVKKGKVALKKAKLACAAGAASACRGTATFSGKLGKKKFTLKVKLSVKPGKSTSITLKLSKKQLKALKRAKRSKGTLRVTFGSRTAKASLTLKS